MSFPQVTEEKRSSDKNASLYQNLLAFFKKMTTFYIHRETLTP